ncbi:MAG: hypothetical protein ACRC8D_06000 [Aeromonas sp.]
MAGSNFELTFDRQALQGIITALEATGPELTKAADRAAKRTLIWMRARITKGVSGALGIPAAKLRTRITIKKPGGNPPAWILFLGVNRMPVDVASTVSQTKRGLRHRGGTVQGGFYQDVFKHGRKGWIRKGRARRLGLKLPGLSGAGSFDDGRFPVLRISHDLEAAATPIVEQYRKQGEGRFLAQLEHEIKYIKGLL